MLNKELINRFGERGAKNALHALTNTPHSAIRKWLVVKWDNTTLNRAAVRLLATPYRTPAEVVQWVTDTMPTTEFVAGLRIYTNQPLLKGGVHGWKSNAEHTPTSAMAMMLIADYEAGRLRGRKWATFIFFTQPKETPDATL